MKKILVLLSVMFSTQVFALSYTCPAGRLSLVQANVGRLIIKCSYKSGIGMPAFSKDIPFGSANYSQKNMNIMLQIAIAAKVNKRAVKIFLESSSAYNPNGCEGHNCRALKALGML